MIKLSVLYPAGEGTKFDINYYCNDHMPLVQKTLGSACRKIEVEQGMAGGAPDSPPTYAAMGHLFFDSVEAFQAAFPQHAETLMADIPNFTNVQPIVQISDVKM